ncbi:MAG: VWA domain-containing protein [Vicinamibacterales bacterium]
MPHHVVPPGTVLFALCLALGASPHAAASRTGQQPIFTADTTLVELDVTVTDRDGHPVRGLTRDDFVVREDGVPQALDSAELIDIPMPEPLADDAPEPVVFPPPEVASNVADTAPPRAYVFILDDLLTRAHRTGRVREAVAGFIREGMAPGDSAAVVFAGTESAAQDFTTDRERLLQAVERFMGRGVPVPTENLVADGPTGMFVPDGTAGHNNSRWLDTLDNAVTALGRLAGPRRAIVLVSEAHGLADLKGTRSDSRVRQMLARAAANNVVIHVVDPAGLTGAKDDEQDIMTGVIRGELLAPRTTDVNFKPLGVTPIESLASLAAETGGVAVVNTNGLREGFSRIVQASSSYYHLAYYPANTARDGRTRQLRVSVRRDGLDVRARRSYVIEKPSKKTAQPTKADELLSSPLPVPGLGLHAQAAVLRKGKDDARALVVVDIDGGDLAFSDRGRETIEYWVLAIDSSGRARDRDTGASELRLRPGRVAEVTTRGVRLIFDLSVGRGRYRIRVAAREREGGRAGSVALDLDVPDFGDDDPRASSILLTSSREGLRVALDRRTASVRGLLPALPSAVRQFGPDEQLALFVEAYPGRAGRGQPATGIPTCTLEVVDARGTRHGSLTQPTTPGEHDAVRCQPTLDLLGLPPGTYGLTITLQLPGANEPLHRETTIQVRPD